MLFVSASRDVHTRQAPSCRTASTYEITVDLPEGAKNMQLHEWTDEYDLRLYRTSIETVNSQLENLGLQRLRARTNEGFDIKMHASLIALWYTLALDN